MADCFLGEIRLFAGAKSVAPSGWAFCEGQSLSIAENQALYSLIGTTYGDSGNSFNLPDLSGRVPIHAGTGQGLSPRNMGQFGGMATVVLNDAQMPAHSHSFNVTANQATQPLPKGNILAKPTPREFYTAVPATSASDQVLQEDTISTQGGGGQPHENRMCSIALRYIIATAGLYPDPQ